MIVGKIWDSEYPWDVRVEKVAQTLSAAGHEVHLACRNRRHEPLREQLPDLTVHRMPPLTGMLEPWDGALSFPAFVSPRWFSFVRGVFAREQVDVVMCRDLPLAPLGLAVARSLGRPVVLDIAEHYPGLLADLYNERDFTFSNLLVRNPLLASVIERFVLPRADGVLVVVDEMAERMVEMGVPRERITVVSNTPRADRATMMGEAPRVPHQPGEPLRIVYLGKIERPRGLDVVIRAVALLKQQNHHVIFEVYGAGKDAATEQALAAQLGVSDRVIFHGHQPYDQVLARLPTFDAGIIPHHATDHCSFTIPNKLFDCMAAGLPVIVSSMPPAARIVRSTGSGFVFKDRDPEDLAKLLRHFPGTAEQKVLGENGRRAVREEYHWDQDAERLVAAIERVADAH